MADAGLLSDALLPERGEGICLSCMHASLGVDEAALRALARRVLRGERKRCRYLGIVLADGATIRMLNRTYRGADYDTDVLSFPLGDGPEVDGEICVNLDFALEHHAAFGATFEEEVGRYVVHGLLHLMGYDDAGTEDRAAMRALEDRYLAPGGSTAGVSAATESE